MLSAITTLTPDAYDERSGRLHRASWRARVLPDPHVHVRRVGRGPRRLSAGPAPSGPRAGPTSMSETGAEAPRPSGRDRRPIRLLLVLAVVAAGIALVGSGLLVARASSQPGRTLPVAVRSRDPPAGRLHGTGRAVCTPSSPVTPRVRTDVSEELSAFLEAHDGQRVALAVDGVYKVTRVPFTARDLTVDFRGCAADCDRARGVRDPRDRLRLERRPQRPVRRGHRVRVERRRRQPGPVGARDRDRRWLEHHPQQSEDARRARRRDLRRLRRRQEPAGLRAW